jgi:hypothetical protein
MATTSTVFKKGEKKPNQGKRGPAKTTKLAKEAIQLAAEGLGGTQRLIEWAQEDPKNESSFWTTIYTKLLPLQVKAEIDGQMSHNLTISFRDVA